MNDHQLGCTRGLCADSTWLLPPPALQVHGGEHAEKVVVVLRGRPVYQPRSWRGHHTRPLRGLQGIVQAHSFEWSKCLLARSGKLRPLLLLWCWGNSWLLWQGSCWLLWQGSDSWLLWRRDSCWLLLLLRPVVALVDLVLDLVEQAERLVGRIAGLKAVEALLEGLLLLLGKLLLLLGKLLLRLSKLLLLLREGLLLWLTRWGLRLCWLLWPLRLLLLLDNRLLLQRLGLRIDGSELGVAGKGGDRLPALV